jgi:DNA-binding NtrC family response regulator
MNPTIVYVDSDLAQLELFKSIMPSEWITHCYASAKEAMAAIPGIDPWVILCENNLKHYSSGIDLLAWSWHNVPHAERILVGDDFYVKRETLTSALRSARICDFIYKPWISYDLIERVLHAFQHKHAV